MKNKLASISLIILTVFNTSFAQQTFSGTTEADSLYMDIHKKKSGYQQTAEVLGIAIPSAMVIYGVISLKSDAIRDIDYQTKDWLVEHNALTNTKLLDDITVFVPTAAAFGMKLAHMESKHDFWDMAIICGLSNMLQLGVVQATKHITERERPDGSENNSFPSGHTATAFAGAEFLHQEYGHQSIWISIGGYTVATFVGVSRVLNNRHWVSDVVAGAGIGILSTKVIYWTYPYIRKLWSKDETDMNNKKSARTMVFPSYNQGCLSLNLSCTF